MRETAEEICDPETLLCKPLGTEELSDTSTAVAARPAAERAARLLGPTFL